MTAAQLSPAEPSTRRVGLTPIESRGKTTIDDQVVEKIATRAVAEVEEVGGAARRVLGMSVGSESAGQRPRLRARVDGSIVTLNVRLSVAYPAPVAKAAQRVRTHLVDRIAELTGLSVRVVDITVTALTVPAAAARRELQ